MFLFITVRWGKSGFLIHVLMMISVPFIFDFPAICRYLFLFFSTPGINRFKLVKLVKTVFVFFLLNILTACFVLQKMPSNLFKTDIHLVLNHSGFGMRIFFSARKNHCGFAHCKKTLRS